MRLKLLGGLGLEPQGFQRHKPLLLLAYLAVEGSKEKRHLYELFWPDAAEQATSLRVAISQLRKLSPELIQSDERSLSTPIGHDLAALQTAISAQDAQQLEALYVGEFLQGFSLPDWSAELEEWVYSTREFIAARVRAAFIRAAEAEAAKGAFGLAADWAEKAYRLQRDPSPEDLERLYPLLVAGDSPLGSALKQQAKEYGLELSLTPEEAKGRYFVASTAQTSRPQGIPHNLPRAKTSFIGRDPELVELGQQISQPTVQLITLLGPGGIGKTRLALELAAEQLQADNFPDGIYFVALEALLEPSQIPPTLAQTLKLETTNDPLSAVKKGIGSKRMLLLLDNFEHLIEGVLLVSELLEACPHLSMVVTSRERLHLEEEHVLPLQGLPFPKEVTFAEAEYVDAVKLFVQRAKRARLDFELTPENLPAVLEICRLVEGSPLGLELAAVWLRSLSVAEIAREIGQNFGLLETNSRNIVGRHQSIWAAFEYSWKLLKPKEQLTLARLSVFRGGFTREAASAVADTNLALLAALVDKSLLRFSEATGRYDVHPLLHQYAGEKLVLWSEEAAQTQNKHANYFLAFAEASNTGGIPKQVEACRQEYENLITALAWSQDNQQALVGLRLAYTLTQFWYTQGYHLEGVYWLNRVLSHPEGKAPSDERLRVLLYATRLIQASDDRLSQEYEAEALAVAQTLGGEDRKARAFLELCMVAHVRRDLERGRRYAEASLELARQLEDEVILARALYVVGGFAMEFGELETTTDSIGQALALYRKQGRWSEAGYALLNLGWVAWLSGDVLGGKDQLEEALAVARRLPDQTLTNLALNNLTGVMQDLGNFQSARELAQQVLESRLGHRTKLELCYSFDTMANLAVALGDHKRAACLWGVTQRLTQEMNTTLPSIWRTRVEQFTTLTKVHLGETSLNAGCREGGRLTLEQAVGLALELIQEKKLA